jgi:hypothetical protein
MGEPDPRLIERILDAFRRHYAERAPFAEDRALADELAVEAEPAIEALVFASAEAGITDPSSIEHHEGLALVTLLGRRAAARGATPTAAMALVPALEAGFREAGHELSEALVEALMTLAMEGYCAGREDALKEDVADEAVEAVGIVRVVPRGLALVLAGQHEPEVLGEVVERFGRALLKEDAKACIIDIEKLADPTRERAAEVLGAHATARMLGAVCIFSGVSEAWLESGREARVDLDLLTIEPTFEAALRRMLPLCGLELRRTSWLPNPFSSLIGKPK